MKSRFSGRLGLQQRVLPNYRVAFFEMLAEACDGGLSVFAGEPRSDEGIRGGALRLAKQARAQNIHLLRGSLYLCEQLGFIRWLEEWDPQALIVEANPRYLATPAAVRWMHARGRKVIGWGLGAPALAGSLKGFKGARRRRFVGQFDALIAYSHRGAREYAALGFPRNRIFVAMNAVAPRPSGARGQASRLAPRVSLLFVGRLQRRKHVDFLLRACAELPPPGPDLVIVGDGPERGALEALATEVYPAARFVGAKYGEELKAYYAAADLFVLPGTGGLAVQEAMTNGLPVIVARGDGTQDDLVRRANGWQIQPEDYGALQRTLKLALSDLPRLRRMGKESYRIVSEEINLEKMVEVFVQALNAIQ